MKYLYQVMIIFVFSFLGELLRFLIPLPIPASIYGMLLLFAALQLKLLSVEKVKSAGGFLASILSLLFVPPVVSLLDYWEQVRSHALAIVLTCILSTVVCFAAAGCITQWLIRKKGGTGQ